MGTFIIRPHIPSSPTTATDVGVWTQNSGSLAAAVLTPVDGNQAFTSLLSGTSSFYMNNLDWYLDGSLVPIGFASLPSGFTVLSAIVNYAVNAGNFFVNGVGHLRFDAFTESAAFTSADGSVYMVNDLLVQFPYPTLPLPTALDLNNGLFGVRYSGGTTGLAIDELSITGTYTLLGYSYTIPEDGNSVEVGDIISITSPGTNPLTDLDLTHLTISMTCGTVVPITQTQTLYTFAVPATCSGAGVVNILATGDGFQFSGSVPLGTLNVLLTNASGIYTLVPGKTNDTLYSSLRDGTTRNVKIPNPFGKTGYIGG